MLWDCWGCLEGLLGGFGGIVEGVWKDCRGCFGGMSYWIAQLGFGVVVVIRCAVEARTSVAEGSGHLQVLSGNR